MPMDRSTPQIQKGDLIQGKGGLKGLSSVREGALCARRPLECFLSSVCDRWTLLGRHSRASFAVQYPNDVTGLAFLAATDYERTCDEDKRQIVPKPLCSPPPGGHRPAGDSTRRSMAI